MKIPIPMQILYKMFLIPGGKVLAYRDVEFGLRREAYRLQSHGVDDELNPYIVALEFIEEYRNDFSVL